MSRRASGSGDWDAITAPHGELLKLPLEHVIVSHGEPVHDRAAFELALDLPAPDGRRLEACI